MRKFCVSDGGFKQSGPENRHFVHELDEPAGAEDSSQVNVDQNKTHWLYIYTGVEAGLGNTCFWKCGPVCKLLRSHATHFHYIFYLTAAMREIKLWNCSNCETANKHAVYLRYKWQPVDYSD